jgi:hypothetical protein
VDSPEGKRGGIYLGAGFYGLNIVDGGGCDFPGDTRFLCGFLLVSLWWIDGELWCVDRCILGR